MELIAFIVILLLCAWALLAPNAPPPKTKPPIRVPYQNGMPLQVNDVPFVEQAERRCYLSVGGHQVTMPDGSPIYGTAAECRGIGVELLRNRGSQLYEIIDFDTGEVVDVVGEYPQSPWAGTGEGRASS